MNGEVSTAEAPRTPRFNVPVSFILISAITIVLVAILGISLLNSGESFGPRESTFQKFKSEAELRDYLAKNTQASFGFGMGRAADVAIGENLEFAAPAALEGASRVSGTNVQVTGLDEPDIVKTDGNHIFFSPGFSYLFERVAPEPSFVESDIPSDLGILPAPERADIKVISAFPVESLGLSAEIEAAGDILLYGNTLMVFEYNRINAFDVSDKQNPREAWSYQYDANYSYQTARLQGGKVHLVATRYADYGMPCPVPVLSGAERLSIACTDIYRPSLPSYTDTMFSVVTIDATSGNVENSVSFVGSAGASVVYISENAVYATFTTYPSILDFMAGFLSENRSVVGNEVASRIENLRSIDISEESKVNELYIILQRYLSGLSSEERTSVEERLTERMTDYVSVHGRGLQVTSVVKINTSNLEVAATGSVPGAPLNQFSLDEFEGNLRIATTIDANTLFGGTSVNDIYVMSPDMNVVGSVTGLAPGERIFSARFMGERAYLVTFKQIDPFFVIDLADPSNPQVAGELKIPGFSSYLHPLSGSRILGVGQEEGNTKLSIFDVADPQNPVESERYQLGEFWSEVQSNHHAFLADSEKQVFFLPAGASGFVFSYGEGLTLVKTVQDINARRAVYINDYLYIVGDRRVVVLDETTWDEINSLDF